MTLFIDRVPDPQLAEWPVFGEGNNGSISSPSHMDPNSSSAAREHVCSTSDGESESDSDNESTAFWHRLARADDVRVRVISGPKLMRRGNVWLEPAREGEGGDQETATGSQEVGSGGEESESEGGHDDPGIVSAARGSIMHDQDWVREHRETRSGDESSGEESESDDGDDHSSIVSFVSDSTVHNRDWRREHRSSCSAEESDDGHNNPSIVSLARNSSVHTPVRVYEHHDSCDTGESDTGDRRGCKSARSPATLSPAPLIDFSPQASPAPLIEFSPLSSLACRRMEGMVMPSLAEEQSGDREEDANDPFLGPPKHGHAWYMSDYTLAPPPSFSEFHQSKGRDRIRSPSPTPGPRTAAGNGRRLRPMPPPGLKFPRGRYHQVRLTENRNYRFPQVCDEDDEALIEGSEAADLGGAST
ncbi:hypothetical protein LTR48_007224 [Friedmanniomyces endolithicus]|uniref:Uncharacterized protein n=1 Tax=Rachicladosporium monterosium TaxID=1507873 RepID=A0ABR0KWU1_9PEZI|nr:hypothetical protein LTR29_009224 [Friedmanniomyces endolithicus]KAK1090985.1 hypothetical protein LTR48_007224 [Friedmanniomyces endolithicus]KAK1816302.1 hypothetical protein LTR12_009292 [Friedmanniomyces endolithicus]KAK5139799.1 hypothetical protein LTR32_007210 [Rachicladosporium monterosium]